MSGKNNSKKPVIDTFKSFSTEELSLISQIKRFMECVQGDPGFKNQVDSGKVTPGTLKRLKKIGIKFEIDEVAMFWEEPQEFAQLVTGLGRACQNETCMKLPESIKKYPLLELWASYSLTRNKLGRKLQGQTIGVPKNKKFNEWRNRRILSTRSELGHFGHVIDHPILAFELGDGCSVGCWFCAFATQKLKKNFDYIENRTAFRSIIADCTNIFGKNAASHALLYYGTEPHDNPHYIDFLKDHAEITGRPSCTSTAFISDTKWMRELINYYQQYDLPWPRLSVISMEMLHKIHDLYPPEELLNIPLLMQMEPQSWPKVSGGRILVEHQGLRGRDPDKYLTDIVPQGSIACVSGFLVNMVNRTIKLVSPCYSSKKWPYGYRIFDEFTFQDENDFRHAIKQIIERNMPYSPSLHTQMRFRDDLVFRAADEGFDLVSPNQIHHFKGTDVYGPIGGMIAQGNMTCNDLYDTAIEKHNINLIMAMSVVKNLFDNGFLDELHPSG